MDPIEVGVPVVLQGGRWWGDYVGALDTHAELVALVGHFGGSSVYMNHLDFFQLTRSLK